MDLLKKRKPDPSLTLPPGAGRGGRNIIVLFGVMQPKSRIHMSYLDDVTHTHRRSYLEAYTKTVA